MEDTDYHIDVLDSMPGSGKTSWAIDFINQSNNDEKFIFITPFLSELTRITRSCPDKHFVQPDPRRGLGRKHVHFLNLIKNGENIVSTHSLFSNINDEIINAIKSENYTLILDECFDVVEKFDIYQDMPRYSYNTDKDALTKQDINTLLEKGFIEVEDDFRITWKDEEGILHKYEPLKRLADRGLLYLVNNSLLLWSFPVEVFRAGVFEKVYILTYQFKFQIQHYYYNYFNLEFKQYHIEGEYGDYKKVLTLNNDYQLEWIEKIKSLINICEENKLNRIGSYYFDARGIETKSSLSKNWYLNNPLLHKKLSNNTMNFIRNYSNKDSNEDIMWTCFNDFKDGVKSKNLPIKHFVPLNARATNDYGHKRVLAYLVNRYLNPFYIQFFLKRNIDIDEDGFALSEFIQWLLRSGIRNGKKIDLYVPSERMRNLLKRFLDGEIL